MTSSIRARRRTAAAALVLATAAFAAPALRAGAAPVSRNGVGASAATAADSITLAANDRFGPTATTVVLVSGQRVEVRRTAADRWVATQLAPLRTTPGRRSEQLIIRGAHKVSGAVTLSAVPASARLLVANGAVDGRLFDLVRVASQPGATTQVVVRYATAVGAVVAARQASGLPGSTYVPGSAEADRATVAVDGGSAFWTAVTRAPAADRDTPAGRARWRNPDAPRVLAPGIASLTLAGAPPAVPPAFDAPTVRLTVAVHATTDPAHWLYRADGEIGWEFGYLFGLAGPAVGASFAESSVTCPTEDCRTIVATFDVPPGSYQLGSSQTLWRNSRFASMLTYRPQIDLFHDRTLQIQADDATFTTMSTPRRSEPSWYAANAVYRLADGDQYTDLIGLGSAYLDYEPGAYVVPSPPSSLGGFRFELNTINQEPLVRMSVAAPAGTALPLTPQYQQRDGTIEQDDFPKYRFPNGTRRYPVLDAGIGAPSDFSGRHFTGTIALIHVDVALDDPCLVRASVLQRAIAAGAAGVIYDPTTGDRTLNHSCLVPLDVEWNYVDDPVVPRIPFVTVQPEEAAALEALLAAGPVSLSVTSVDNPSYVYVNSPAFQAAMPASAQQTVRADDVATHVARLHAEGADVPSLSVIATRAPDNLSYGTLFGLWTPSQGPSTVTEYLGPASPDAVFANSWDGCARCIDGTPDVGYTQYQPIPADTATTEVGYGERPYTPGPPSGLSRLARVARTSWLCPFCRQGNTLYAVVGMQAGGAATSSISAGPFGRGTTATLWADGAVVAPVSDISWHVPAARTDYRLRIRDIEQDTSWRFTAQGTASSDLPYGSLCVGIFFGDTTPCAETPLVFLRYDAGLDGRNTQAPGARTIDVQGYREGVGAAPVTTLRTSVSFNGGHTWTAATMTPAAHGHWRATFTVPPRSQTDGFVTVRTAARDADGNEVLQTLHDAWSIGA